MTRPGPFLRTSYLESNEVLPRPYHKVLVLVIVLVLLLPPMLMSNFYVHLLNTVLLAVIAVVGLNLLTGYCGQISLGHAAFLAIGAFTTVILTRMEVPFVVVIPAAGVIGAAFGLAVGLPSLRFRGIYLAISTLAMHYAVVYVVTTYQSSIGSSASGGVYLSDPSLFGFELSDDRAWYYFLFVATALTIIFVINLSRSRVGRAWMAIRDRDIAAAALGINVLHFKLLAFVTSSTLASIAGSLAAYYQNVVTSEAYTLELAVAYLAMIIVGGMGSVLGAIFGAMFITLLPYGVDFLFEFAPNSWRFGGRTFGVQQGMIGVFIILFLLFEPKGLVEMWRRIETYFERWPFRYRPLEQTRR